METPRARLLARCSPPVAGAWLCCPACPKMAAPQTASGPSDASSDANAFRKWNIWQVETLFALVISQSLRLPLSFRPPARPPFRPLGPLFLSQALPCSCHGHVLSVTTHYCARPPPRPLRPTGSRRSYYRLRPITALLCGPPHRVAPPSRTQLRTLATPAAHTLSLRPLPSSLKCGTQRYCLTTP
ncbi:hypothetical protein B0H13DRAFT_2340364 [Mycena leptocephala]|nr:hypothetical protein B0H13DRAFT_2340364 [Mycena leptocephala]